MKRCYRCKEVKPLSDFSPDKNRKDGHQAGCKACGAAQARAWYARNKERSAESNRNWRRNNREYHNERSKKWYRENIHRPEIKAKRKRAAYKTKYGITDHAQLVDASGGKCALCGSTPKKLVVDHCHETGAVRDLICQKCNLGLGFFDDDPDSLLRAFRYLHEHRHGQLLAEA